MKQLRDEIRQEMEREFVEKEKRIRCEIVDEIQLQFQQIDNLQWLK